MKFFVLDERHVWHEAIVAAATARGFDAKRIFRGTEVDGEGYGFIRCHAEPNALQRNQRDWDEMSARLTMIQDEAQVRLYENKSGQFERWADWMPETYRFTDLADAEHFGRVCELPMVSKADVGASSVNVRVMTKRPELLAHISRVFGPGVPVNHCSGGAKSLQKGYVLLQRFIPHKVTWRVNALGNCRAAFMRYCYPGRPVAQTGNVEPVMQMTDQIESLFEFSNRFFNHARTKWCAIDVLQDGDEWRLLETSLAWPYPSPGRCNDGTIFGSNRRRKWIDMFDVMMDEVEAGCWR